MPAPFSLFEVIGVELEYMIVDRESLAVRPIADELIKAECGRYEMEIELGEFAWSNEFVLHVIEFKTNGPAPSLDGLLAGFTASAARANAKLEPMGAMLMPTGMHPTMHPGEARLWPHGNRRIYESFHRIYDCCRHGWSNLQSMHVNLPFGDDQEFGRLHAAIRLILPILPALAASSPIVEGKKTGLLDTRLEFYRTNSSRTPSTTGIVIPEPVFTQAEYERCILQRIYDQLAPHDPDEMLRHEWANARGAIARFDRGSIEIRLLDMGEAPIADLAVAALATAVVRGLCEGRFIGYPAQCRWSAESLASILLDCVRDADRAVVRDAAYLDALGYGGAVPCAARDLWIHLLRETLEPTASFKLWRPALETLLEEGCLARRILTRLGDDPSATKLQDVYRELSSCLAAGTLFHANA